MRLPAVPGLRASTAVPDGPRPTSTIWLDRSPPVWWAPSSGEFASLWDIDAAGALGIPGVWHARMLISQAIGGMPLASWKGANQDKPTPTLLVEPNPGEDRANTVAAWVCDLLDHGNAVGVVTGRDSDDRVTSLAPVRAVDVEVRWGEAAPVYRVGNVDFTRRDVFHAKGTCLPGQLRGMGVLEAGLGTLQRLQDEAAYAGNAFRSGVPSGLLRVKDPDLQVGSDDDPAGYVTAKGIKKAWQSSISTGDVAVLSELVDFTPLSWTPSDAQMVEARQLSLTDIAALFNLDGFWLGAPSAPMVYQNVQQAAVQLARFTLGFWLTALEAEFSRCLLAGHEARFNRDSILRDDTTTRVANYEKLIGMGVMTVDEVRALEGLPPLPGPVASVSPLFPAQDAGGNEAVG